MVQVSLTPAGWDRFERLEAEKPKSDLAFVAMRFSEEMTVAYDDGFHPALYELGYRPIRVDREEYLGKIDDFIFANIRKSGLLVADFTEMRSGVFFEAGFGMGLGIPVVWTCRKDFSGLLGEHFDTRQYNHLIWTDPADLKAKLRLRIEAAVIGRPKPRS
jgi:nucleoside 2-deoxyribosyltransferase